MRIFITVEKFSESNCPLEGYIKDGFSFVTSFFVEAAQRAKVAGFDAVNISGAGVAPTYLLITIF